FAEKNKGHRSSVPGCFGYPLSIFFIVINEFCERFSYYGMRAVLVLYFKYFLSWDDNLATAIYHTFVALCYLTPILGALVADSWLGKFKTIVYLSIVYTIGQTVLSVGSINDMLDQNKDGVPDDPKIPIALSMVGLVLIALGTGGIKPCVAAFGGDQFEDHQEKQRTRFFSIFYLSINAGSLISTIVTPILRELQCGIHTTQQCYPLAFGIPAVLMAVALLVFIAGSTMYKKVEPQGNIMIRVVKCIVFAVRNRFKHRSKQYPKREHWMDWANEKYDKQLIAQIKMVLKVLFLYIPLPMFWALFDQQGSRWTLQATTMNGDFTVNPILIIIMVPVVDAVLYPLIKKCHINFTPLRKMTVGMLLAALAFVAAALVQIQIDKTLPVFPMDGESQIKVINLGNENAAIKFTDTLPPVNVASSASVCVVNNCRLYLTICICIMNSIVFKRVFCLLRFISNMNSTVNITMSNTVFTEVTYLSVTNYTAFKRGSMYEEMYVCLFNHQNLCNCQWLLFSFLFKCNNDSLSLGYVEDIEPNTINMAWQIPQYFIITCAEVVFSVTGLSFSYSQAPANMKSVLQAGWLLTVAVGNIIVLIIAGASKLSEQWAEYVLFASLLVGVTIIFAIMAYFYTYVDPAEVEAQFNEDENKREEKVPPAYTNGTGPVLQTQM
uniref:Solute carrier family 15 member 1 n=1 Tax=Salvator merianae TaxID=96440 RepID=A0A8D0CA06_SALMN